MNIKNTHIAIGVIIASTMSGQAITLIGPSVNNGSFESEVTKQQSWDTVSNWTNWDASFGGSSTNNSDSGTESNLVRATDGSNVSFFEPGNAAFNMTGHILGVGDVITYQWDYPAADRGDIQASLAYMDASLNVVNIVGTETNNPDRTTAHLDLGTSYTVQAGDAFVGRALGFTLNNNFGPSDNYPEVDNVRLDVTQVPEPSSSALVGLASVAFLIRRRR